MTEFEFQRRNGWAVQPSSNYLNAGVADVELCYVITRFSVMEEVLMHI